MEQLPQIIFFDTFKHADNENKHLDQIRFSSAVNIREIRIIPNGRKVALGVEKYGSTNPSHFALDVYAYNIHRSTAHVYQRIARLDFNEQTQTRCTCDVSVTTTHVILVGQYISVTLAIMGETPRPAQAPVVPIHSIPQQHIMSHQQYIRPQMTGAPIPTIGGGQMHSRMVFNPHIPPPLAMLRAPHMSMVPPIHSVSTPIHPISMPPPMQTNAPTTIGLPLPYDPSRPPPGGHMMHPPHSAPPGVVLAPPPTAPADIIPPVPPGLIAPPNSASSNMYPSPVSRSKSGRSPSTRESGSRRSRSRDRESSRRREKRSEPKWKPIGQTAEDSERRKEYRDSSKRSQGRQPSRDRKREDSCDRKSSSGRSPDRREHRRQSSGSARGPSTARSSDSCSKEERLEQLENISDEEEDFEHVDSEVDLSEADEQLLDKVTSRFHPEAVTLKPLLYFNPPWKASVAIAFDTFYDTSNCDDDSPALEFAEFVRNFKSGFSHNADEWLLRIEKFIPALPMCIALAVKEIEKEVIEEALFKWTAFGLHYKSAFNHSQPVFIIRHLKAGFKLANLVFTMSENVCRRLIQRKVQHTLIDLLEQEHMCLPLQLLIVTSLDASLYYSCGMQAMQSQSREPDDCSPDQEVDFMTPYQRFASFMTQGQNCRLLSVARCLMRKIELDESLSKISELTSKMNTPSFSGEDLDTLCVCLTEATNCHKFADQIIAVDKSILPISKTYSVRKSAVDPYPAIYQQLLNHDLMKNVYRVCSIPLALESGQLMQCIRDVLLSLISRSGGILFLACQMQTTTILLSKLMRLAEGDPDSSLVLDICNTSKDAAYAIFGMQCIDALFSFFKSSSVPFSTESRLLLEPLHQLYATTLNVQARQMLSQVISYDDNILALLPCLEPTGDPEVDSRLRKSACHGYAAELLLVMMRCCDCSSALMVGADRLAKICSQEGANANSRLLELRQWVDVIKRTPADHVECVQYLSDRVKSYVTEGVTPRIPRGLITSLRLLQAMIVPPEIHPDSGKPMEIKYDYCLFKMYSADAFTSILQLLNKMSDSYLINWQQGVSLNSKEGTLFQSCVSPAVAIIKAVIGSLIKVRGSQFTDVSVVEPLVHLYTLNCTMQNSNMCWCKMTHKLHRDIMDTLSSFIYDSDSKGGKSLWSRTVAHILTYANSCPHAFVGAISVLSELLPVPLPIPYSGTAPDESLSMKMLSLREDWACHLVPLQSQIEGLLKQLAVTTHPALQQTLRRVCILIADLNSNMNVMVAKAILSCVLDHCEEKSEKVKSEKEDKDKTTDEESEIGNERELVLPCGPYLQHVLHTLWELCSLDTFKSAVLEVLRKSAKSKFSRIVNNFCLILTHQSDIKCHLNSQELILSVLTVLCDDEIGLKLIEESGTFYMNRLLMQSDMEAVCDSVLQLLGHQKQTYANLIQGVGVLLQLEDHDFGTRAVHDSLRREPEQLQILLNRLSEEWNSPDEDIHECLASVLQFITNLVKIPEDTEGEVDDRTQVLGSDFVRSLVEIKGNAEEEQPLNKLKKHLMKCKDSKLRAHLEKLNGLISLIKEDISGGIFTDRDVEYVALDILFAQRPTFFCSGDKKDDWERISICFWFPACTLHDLDDSECEKMTCDLESLRQKFLPQFDPKEELLKRVSVKQIDRPKARRGAPHRIINTSRGEKRLMPAPLRGRGFVPRGNLNSRVKDHFRSRQQNTSRAPSMHVDDFIIMEGNSKPTNANDNRERRRDNHRQDFVHKFRPHPPGRSRFMGPPSHGGPRRFERGRGHFGRPRGGGGYGARFDRRPKPSNVPDSRKRDSFPSSMNRKRKS